MDLSLSLVAGSEGQESEVSLSFDNLNFDLLDDYPIESLSDLLDYTYYSQAKMATDIQCDAIRLTQKRGHAKTEYEYPIATFSSYASEGDIYLDLSAIDLSDIGIEANKYKFTDGFSFLKDERIQQLRDLLAIPELDMQALLSASTENAVIESAIHMERNDRERFRVSFDLSSETIAEVVSYFGDDVSAEEAKAKIDQYVVFDSNTALEALYNMKENTISAIGLRGGISLPLDKIDVGGVQVDLSKTHMDFDLDLEWLPCPDFSLPSFEDYEEFQLPEAPADSSEENSLEESTSPMDSVSSEGSAPA